MILKDVVRILCIFSSLSFLDTLLLYLRSYDHVVIANLVFVDIYTFKVVIIVLSPIFTCVVSFLSLCTCFLFLYAIYYFCFTLRCLDEFCLKCFRNIGCQSLLSINSLLANFFKILC